MLHENCERDDDSVAALTYNERYDAVSFVLPGPHLSVVTVEEL